MNIFRKIREYDGIKNQLEKVTRININKTNEIKELKNILEQIENERDKYLWDLKHSRSANGGYKAKINNQKKEIEQLKKELEEARNGKYILKRLPKSRIPKGECMKIKSSEKTSLIAKTLKVED